MNVKNLINRVTGRFGYGCFSHGADFFADLARRDVRLDVIFDVGANKGQSAVAFARAHPQASIVSFEPFEATFKLLRANTSALRAVLCEHKALGAEAGETSVVLRSGSLQNSLRPLADNENTLLGNPVESVEVETLDGYCRTHDIHEIDFLKIDTEGYDLEVLKGGRRLLEEQAVGFIQVEAGMNPYDEVHVPLVDFIEYLAPFDYVFFGIYDQTPEWSGEARLRFTNPVFISGRRQKQLGIRPVTSRAGKLCFRSR